MTYKITWLDSLLGTLVGTIGYFVMVGSFYLLVFFAVIIFQALVCWVRRKRFWPRASKVGVFLFILLCAGGIGEVIWNLFVAGRLYITSDYVFGYLPFLPITRGELDDGFAGDKGALLNGASLTTINIIWSVITALVCGSSILIYRRVISRQYRQTSMSPEAEH